jgi:hypothetical protein
MEKQKLVLTGQQICKSLQSPLGSKAAYEVVGCVQVVWPFDTDQDSHLQ